MSALALWLATCVLWQAGATSPGAAAPGGELESWVRALDAGEEPSWSQALERLTTLGAPAATRVLQDFETRTFSARRARAQLLAKLPAASLAAPVLALADDPDPEVRRELATLLGNPALAEVASAERVAALARLAREDADDGVRRTARQALVECALDEAVGALDGLIDALPLEEAAEVASGLTQLPTGRERLIARLTDGGARSELALPVRVALLRGYGRALAEVPGGGEAQRERLPFLRARIHPAPELQLAARAALTTFVARAAELSESERAERVLAKLGEEGWPPIECLRRRLDLAWLERGDATAALALAQDLARATRALAADEAEGWELRAGLFEGAALAALGRTPEASRAFDALVARLEAGRARRTDLFPSPIGKEPPMEAGGVERIDHLHLLALAHLWRALLALGQPDAVHAELRAVHMLFLESRVVAVRTRAGDPGNLDSLLDRDLSPYTLLLFNEHLAPAQRSAALDRALALGRAWGEVAPLEMQGLAPEGAEGSASGDLFRDPERLALLKAIREARKGELLRQQDELTLKRSHGDVLEIEAEEEWNVILSQFYPIKEAEKNERELLGEKPATPPRNVYLQLLDYLTPSMHAYTLAGELRSDGRSAEARELCEHALAVLRTAPLGSSIWSELSSARFENLRGSALMDESRPREAEQAYLESEKRLAAIEVKVNEWIASSKDPQPARAYLTQIQNLRGDALLSLAVNANVRLGDPAKALEYFERAYVLNQNPFMRVLRACYRARSGKKDEARTVLASVVPVPSLYYNIACTHALLGEKEAALDYLERDIRENCPSPGSLAQKRAWAAKDPDIASLREEPRFQRLLGGP